MQNTCFVFNFYIIFLDFSNFLVIELVFVAIAIFKTNWYLHAFTAFCFTA